MSKLEITDLNVGYGDLQVLWDVSLRIQEADSVVALVGPNGTGKTTLLETISGLNQPMSGEIQLFETDVVGWEPERITKHGFIHVSEERNLFQDMSVYRNLKMGAYTQRDKFEETLENIYEIFPILEERSDQEAGTLSGGQQQMLAIGRGLMAQPKILALDEPSEGLAPQLAERVFNEIEAISNHVTVLLVEQHVDQALEMADSAYLLENGRIETKGTGQELLHDAHIDEAYL
jgi:branched-chain amino acid transport system ATP-binding protein